MRASGMHLRTTLNPVTFQEFHGTLHIACVTKMGSCDKSLKLLEID